MGEASLIRLNVKGMTCGGCAAAVTRVVQKSDPAAQVDIDLATGKVEIRSTAEAPTLAGAVSKAGYPAEVA